MSDKPIVHIGENSPEQIALNLYRYLRESPEEKRQKELAIFAQCLMAVRQPADIAPGYKR